MPGPVGYSGPAPPPYSHPATRRFERPLTQAPSQSQAATGRVRSWRSHTPLQATVGPDEDENRSARYKCLQQVQSTIGQQLPMAESALVREELRKVDRSTGLSTFNRIFDGFSKSTFHVSNVPNIPTLRGPILGAMKRRFRDILHLLGVPLEGSIDVSFYLYGPMHLPTCFASCSILFYPASGARPMPILPADVERVVNVLRTSGYGPTDGSITIPSPVRMTPDEFVVYISRSATPSPAIEAVVNVVRASIFQLRDFLLPSRQGPASDRPFKFPISFLPLPMPEPRAPSGPGAAPAVHSPTPAVSLAAALDATTSGSGTVEPSQLEDGGLGAGAGVVGGPVVPGPANGSELPRGPLHSSGTEHPVFAKLRLVLQASRSGLRVQDIGPAYASMHKSSLEDDLRAHGMIGELRLESELEALLSRMRDVTCKNVGPESIYNVLIGHVAEAPYESDPELALRGGYFEEATFELEDADSEADFNGSGVVSDSSSMGGKDSDEGSDSDSDCEPLSGARAASGASRAREPGALRRDHAVDSVTDPTISSDSRGSSVSTGASGSSGHPVLHKLRELLHAHQSRGGLLGSSVRSEYEKLHGTRLADDLTRAGGELARPTIKLTDLFVRMEGVRKTIDNTQPRFSLVLGEDVATASQAPPGPSPSRVDPSSPSLGKSSGLPSNVSDSGFTPASRLEAQQLQEFHFGDPVHPATKSRVSLDFVNSDRSALHPSNQWVVDLMKPSGEVGWTAVRGTDYEYFADSAIATGKSGTVVYAGRLRLDKLATSGDPSCPKLFAVKKVLCTLEESAALAAATSDTFEDLPKSLAAEKMMFLEASNRLGSYSAKYITTSALVRSGRNNNFMFIVMELYCSTLKDRLDESLRFPLSLEEKRYIVKHLCKLVFAMDEKRIWHRDFRIENVLVDSFGRLRIADFGYSKGFIKTSADAPTLISVIPRSDDGPVCFQPREVLKGPDTGDDTRVSRSSDVFMLGVAIFIVWTGGLLPFCEQEKYDKDAMVAHKAAVIDKLPPLLDRIDDTVLRHLLAKCLRHNSSRRPKITEVLQHPFFLESREYIKALMEVKVSLERHREFCRTLERKHLIGDRLTWWQRVPLAVQKAFPISPWNTTKLKGLIQFIRNVAAHWRDLVYQDAEVAMLSTAPEWIGSGGVRRRMDWRSPDDYLRGHPDLSWVLPEYERQKNSWFRELQTLA